MEQRDKNHLEGNEVNNSAITTPAIESFFDTTTREQIWPANISKNESFVEQIEDRRHLIETVENTIQKLSRPDILVEQALTNNEVNEKNLQDLFLSLSKLLESGLGYERIILYLPFEFLPDLTWQSESPELNSTLNRFRSTYLSAWKTLLSAQDVRANFVDGDVPELELRNDNLPRVVKAAHLIPVLVEKGIIQVSEILSLIETTEDPVLRQNVGEALLVMLDLGLVTEELVPKNIVIQKHADEVSVVTNRREKWLKEMETQKSAEPLTKPKNDAYKLKATYADNFKEMTEDAQEIKEIINLIQADEVLSEMVYPVIIVSGSRLKGYGNPDSDLDIGIFVKPDVNPKNRLSLDEHLRRILTGVKNINEPIEFWLEENDRGLKVRTIGSDPLLGESFQTQWLLGSIFEGDEKIIQMLREKLLGQYFYETDEKIYGQEARKMCLGELERDALQYRLMHKGYERFFPPCGGISTVHSDRIDGQSMFWDSGYRQLATQLFLRRVFLPQIPKKEE